MHSHLAVVSPPCRNGTPMSLQNEHENGTLHRTEEPSGMKVHMKVSTLERSEGVGMLVVERHRPPYNRRKDSTIIEPERELMRQEICGVRRRRTTRAAFDSTTTTMDQWKGCYGTASCLISSHFINHASSILSNELSNTYLISVWLL